MQKDKKYYDDFFTKYPANVHDSAVRFNAVSALLSGRVLDVACGTGTLSEYYADGYVGVDISSVAVEIAKKIRRKNAGFVQMDFTENVGHPKEKYDCAYLGEFLEHISDDENVFLNLKQALKTGGRVVVSVPNGERVPDESHCRVFTVPQIRKEYSKYGKITFHNWSGFSQRILFSIDFDGENSNKLSLVMIVKDEEKGLEKAVLSALPIVDHVVISVDSQSTDKTEEIARLYADELKFHDWQGDFSKARNYAQENVVTDWILFIDGHEYIESYGDFAEKINSDVDGIFVTIRMESGMTFLFPRIYRRHIKFKNAVHNINECKTRRHSPNFVIVHDRLNGQDEKSTERRNKQREEMMPFELQKQIEKDPTNARAHFHLANFYMMRKKTKLAMKHYRYVIKFSKSPDEKYLSLLHFGALHASLGHNIRALWTFDKADKLIPGRWESARVIGGLYYMTERYEKAATWLVQALTPNSRHYAYEPMKQNLVEIWDLIGHCFSKLDKNEQAIRAWSRAKELAVEKQKKAFFQQKIDLVKSLLPSSSVLSGSDNATLH